MFKILHIPTVSTVKVNNRELRWHREAIDCVFETRNLALKSLEECFFYRDFNNTIILIHSNKVLDTNRLVEKHEFMIVETGDDV